MEVSIVPEKVALAVAVTLCSSELSLPSLFLPITVNSNVQMVFK